MSFIEKVSPVILWVVVIVSILVVLVSFENRSAEVKKAAIEKGLVQNWRGHWVLPEQLNEGNRP